MQIPRFARGLERALKRAAVALGFENPALHPLPDTISSGLNMDAQLRRINGFFWILRVCTFKTILFFFFFMKLFLIFIIKCSSSFFCKSGEKGTGGKFGEGRVQVRLERGIIKIEDVSLNERGLSYSMLSNVNTTLFLLTQIIFAARLHVYRRLVIFLSFS